MTPLDYTILALIVIGVPVLIFGWLVLNTSKKKVNEVMEVSYQDILDEIEKRVRVAEEVRSARYTIAVVSLFRPILQKLSHIGSKRVDNLMYRIASLDNFIKLNRLELETERFQEYCESDNYEKNRVAIYAYDSLRDPSLKKFAERLLSKLTLRFPSGNDPYHLLQIGKIASQAIQT